MSDRAAVDILIVDDDPTNLAAMEAALSDLGERVVRARSGFEALRLLLDRDFALIVLDVKMPSLGGVETAQMIRARERSRHTPIIFITAYGRDEGDVLSAYKLGAVDFLFKPIVAEVVRAKASVFVELQRRAAEIARQAEQLREHDRREHERALVEQRSRLQEEVLRRERDALAAADRHKDEFLAMLGHELRTPLASITTDIEALGRKLAKEATAADAHRTHARIDRQLAHLTRLADDLADIARINSNKIELRPEPIPIQDVIEQAVSMCRPMFAEREQSLAVNTPESPITLTVDAMRITQVIANLLTNAARYTPRGGQIRVDCQRQGDFVEVAVVDSGRGIAPELLPRIFDMFVQAKESADAGLGLGLAIVKRLVAMHDGVVTASSPGPDQGSEFKVRLPVPGAGGVSPAAQPARSSTVMKEASPVFIAVVEDNEDLREAMKELLEELGHKVVVAEDGRSGTELILRLEPDVAFVDIGLPDLDGYGVAAHIRKHLGSDRIKLVAMTGFGQPADRQRSAESRFDAHFVKPPTIDTLERILSSDTKDGHRADE